MRKSRRQAGTIFSGGTRPKGGSIMDVKQYKIGRSLSVPHKQVSRNNDKMFGKGF